MLSIIYLTIQICAPLATMTLGKWRPVYEWGKKRIRDSIGRVGVVEKDRMTIMPLNWYNHIMEEEALEPIIESYDECAQLIDKFGEKNLKWIILDRNHRKLIFEGNHKLNTYYKSCLKPR